MVAMAGGARAEPTILPFRASEILSINAAEGAAAIHIELGILMAMDGAAVGEEVMRIGQGLWVGMGRGNMVAAVAMDALVCRVAVAAGRGMVGTVVVVAGGRLARGLGMVEVGNAAVVVVVVVTTTVEAGNVVVVVVVTAAVEVAVVTAVAVMVAEET